jgi:hypothetical protein
MDKARFWDPIREKYPEEFGDFAKWCDEWKRRSDWTSLFPETFESVRTKMGLSFAMASTKIHDLPPPMQIGIFIQYTVESGLSFIHAEFVPQIMDDYIGSIEAWFAAVRELNSVKH